MPYINYGILVWGNACKKHLDKLVKLQKWAIRTISCSHYRSHTGPLFAKHNILTIHDMYSLELGVFMYKYSTDQLPSIFKDYFTKRSDVHAYQTRSINNLYLTRNKSFLDNAVRTTGPILWNNIDNGLKNFKTIKYFRKEFKGKLISTYNW